MNIEELIKRRIERVDINNMPLFFKEREWIFNKDSSELISKVLKQIELDIYEIFKKSLGVTIDKMIGHIGNDGKISVNVKKGRSFVILHDKNGSKKFIKKGLKKRDANNLFFVFQKSDFDENKFIKVMSMNSLVETDYCFENASLQKICSFVEDTVEIFDDLPNKSKIVSKENKNFFDKLGFNVAPEEAKIYKKLHERSDFYLALIKEDCNIYASEEEKISKGKILAYFKELLTKLFVKQPLSLEQLIDGDLTFQKLKLNGLKHLEIKAFGFQEGASLYNLDVKNTDEIIDKYKLILTELKKYPLGGLDTVYFNLLLDIAEQNNETEQIEKLFYKKYLLLSEKDKNELMVKSEYKDSLKGLFLYKEIFDQSFDDILLKEDNKILISIPIEIFIYQARRRGFSLLDEEQNCFESNSSYVIDEFIREEINKNILREKIFEILNDENLFIKKDSDIMNNIFIGLSEVIINNSFINGSIRKMNLLNNFAKESERTMTNRKKI